MIPFVASTLLLVQMSAFVTGTHYCREHRPVDQQFCGNEPTVSNDPAILKWDRGGGSRVENATLDIRKIDRAWSQTGCFNIGNPISGSGPVPASSEHTLSSVDYDSLYIAKLFWESDGTSYYIKDGDCYFTLQPTPSAPQNVAAVHTTSSSITWTWDPPANHGNKVTYYQISYYLYYWLSNGATTNGTYYQMSELSGNSHYCFQARAVTGSGNYGYWSSWHCRTTLPATPSGPHVSIDGSTAQSVRLTLSGCSSPTVGPFRYIVTYHSDSGNELTVETVTSTSPPSLLTVRDLWPGKQYSFKISCENSAGVIGPSVSTTVTTLSEETLQPRISSVVVNNSSDFADISWDAPSAVDLVSGYDVQVVPHVGGTPQSPSVYLMASSSRYSRSYRVMQSLMPETLYTFQVRANTSVGTSQWSTPVVRSTLPAVPERVNGFSVNSSLPTTISMLWSGSNATVDYYMLTLHNAEANITDSENYDLFHTVTSHTFHNLSPSTAYSLTITAINKAGSGPPVSVNVTTQGTDGGAALVQPLAVTTGIFVSIVFIVVAGLLLTGGAWCIGRHIFHKLRALHRKEDECEIEENVAYATAHGDRVWSQNFFLHTKEEEEDGQDHRGYEGEGEEIPELDYAPDLPSREYLKQKEKGPTEFASIPVYPDEESFHNESGWFESAPADVIAGKLGIDVAAFADLGSGVYLMCHKTKKQAKWVGLSPDLCRTLCGHFFQLYHKERSQLSPIEVELKFFSPLAADWDIQVWTAEPKELVLERAKKIVEFKTLKPRGLNTSLTLTGKEMWEEFISWFQAKRRNQK